MVKERLCPKTAKLDCSLARLQALALDAIGLLTVIVDQGEKGDLTTKQAVEAAKLALKFTYWQYVSTILEREAKESYRGYEP